MPAIPAGCDRWNDIGLWLEAFDGPVDSFYFTAGLSLQVRANLFGRCPREMYAGEETS